MKIILDTDIGDDIDDALALGFILGSPELELVGVTTVFGNVTARAKQARTVLKVAGERFARIPVCAGCGASMASRPLHNLRSYLENELPNQDPSCLPEDQLCALDPRHGVSFLVEQLASGDIIPVTIGAMTNLAMAFVMDWRLTKRVPKIVCMAGEFRRPMAEWNIKCDVEAAHIIFSCGVPVDVTPWHIGMEATLNASELARLNASETPLMKRLAMAVVNWQGNRTNKPMPHLFDPMALETMIRPELCTWKRGRVAVEVAGAHTYGYTIFREDKDGPHRIAWDVKRDEAIGFWFDRVERV